jgi:hypothetical protein
MRPYRHFFTRAVAGFGTAKRLGGMAWLVGLMQNIQPRPRPPERITEPMTSPRLSVALGLLAQCALVLNGPLARAQTQAIDFTGGDEWAPFSNAVMGWQFNLSTIVTLTDLGHFDEGNDGFGESHQVALWTTGGTLLASTTLASGLSGTPVVSASGLGAFRYNPVTPVVLTPGDYVLGTYSATELDSGRYDVSSTSTAAGFTFTQARYSISGSGFVLPAFTFPTTGGVFGPNLRFAASAAPEPGSLCLLSLLALPGLSRVRASVRRRRAAHPA